MKNNITSNKSFDIKGSKLRTLSLQILMSRIKGDEEKVKKLSQELECIELLTNEEYISYVNKNEK